MRVLPLLGPAVPALLLGLALIPVMAQEPPSAAAPRGTITAPPPMVEAVPPPTPAPRATGASQIPANGQRITLEVNKGTLVRLAGPASTVFVANPDIADVQVKSPTLIYITAKAPGETVIYAVDASDNVLLNAPILVEHDISRLRSSLRQLVPGERIEAQSVDGNLVLSGPVSDPERAEKARALAVSIAGEVKGSQVINRMSVVGPNQVNLRVRVAEIDRNILRQIGVDWTKFNPTALVNFETFNTSQPRSVTSFTTVPTTTTSSGVVTTTPPTVTTALPSTNAFLTIGLFPGAPSATIEALGTEGFLTILAEPNLTATSGQTASFLAGGEFPVPVVQSVAAGAAPTVTILFKQFGVQLAFTPTILDLHRISLKVRPEVSALSTQGEVTISGFTVPALTVRRAETTVELASGQTFALAGLLQHNTEQDINKVPWLGDIPVLGALFRSNKFTNNETELVIIVTPYLVNPVATRMAAPTDAVRVPNEAQQIWLGDTYREAPPGSARGPLNGGGGGLVGPAGFWLD